MISVTLLLDGKHVCNTQARHVTDLTYLAIRYKGKSFRAENPRFEADDWGGFYAVDLKEVQSA